MNDSDLTKFFEALNKAIDDSGKSASDSDFVNVYVDIVERRFDSNILLFLL